jgi:hypothetical protein
MKTKYQKANYDIRILLAECKQKVHECLHPKSFFKKLKLFFIGNIFEILKAQNIHLSYLEEILYILKNYKKIY